MLIFLSEFFSEIVKSFIIIIYEKWSYTYSFNVDKDIRQGPPDFSLEASVELRIFWRKVELRITKFAAEEKKIAQPISSRASKKT